MHNALNMAKRLGLSNQLIRYVSVGVFTNVTGYVIYLIVTWFGMQPKLAMSLLYIAGATAGFVGHRSLSFSYRGGVLGAGLRYLVAQFFGYVLNLTMLVIFVDRFGFRHQVVQAIAVIVVAIFLFLTFRYFVFPTPDEKRTGSAL